METAVAAQLLTGLISPTAVSVTADSQANWLIRAGLGAMTQARLPIETIGGRAQLRADSFAAAGEAAIRWEAFQYLGAKLHQANLPVVPLKGMALGLTVYDEPSQRTMSDIDLWLDDAGMTQAAQLMPQWGFTFSDKDDRPFELQKLADGEMRFVHPNWPQLLIELHWSPFPGWWLARTAAVDSTAVYQRLTPHPLPQSNWPIHLLTPEDTMIQLIVHLAVNHQFSLSGVRTLVDMALLAQKYTVDWDIVVRRAQAWRVATAVWLTLTTALDLLPLRGLTQTTLDTIAPSPLHQRQLRHFVTPHSLVNGRDMTQSWQRYLLLALLVDRRRDRLKLIGRTLWPEPEWLKARYGGTKNNWQHLAHLLQSRTV